MHPASHLDKIGEGKKNRRNVEKGVEIRQVGLKKRAEEEEEGETEVMKRQESSLPKAVTNNMHTLSLILSITVSSENAL